MGNEMHHDDGSFRDISKRNISETAQKTLEYVFKFINDHIPASQPTNFRSQSFSSHNNQTQHQETKKITEKETREAAARVLQRAVRQANISSTSSLYHAGFFSERNRHEYLSLLKQQYPDPEKQQTSNLADIMYGRTISPVRNLGDAFPANPHSGWEMNLYHREDEIIGELYENLLNEYHDPRDPGALRDRSAFYIPFINIKNASIDDLIKMYLSKEERSYLTDVQTLGSINDSIGILVLESLDNVTKDYKKKIINKIDELVPDTLKEKWQDANELANNDIIFIPNGTQEEVDAFIDAHLGDEKKFITSIDYEDEFCVIGFSIKDQYKEDTNRIIGKIRSAGLIPSTWEIAQANVLLNNSNIQSVERRDNPANADTTIDQPLIPKSVLDKLPSSVNALKSRESSELMVELSKIAISNSPCKLLAACLHRMITGLPDVDPTSNIGNEIAQRISLFLSFGVRNYSQDYDRFAFIVYAVTHEISLLIKEATNHGIHIADYENFKKTIEKYSISSFGLQRNQKTEYTSIAAPTMSGTHAFLAALNLAKKSSAASSRPLTIHANETLYYEFEKFIALEAHQDTSTLADIYHISAGPVMSSSKGLIPGTDINKYIRRLSTEHTITEPITILIDVTSALHKNLKLDDDIQALVTKGSISIICYESYQKFGLIHTDQVQAGVVYGVLSDKAFTPSVIDQFQHNAKDDLENHLDMIIAQYIHQNCGEYLEKIKAQHFLNGNLIRKFFESHNTVLNPKQFDNTLHRYDEMLSNLDELYFFLYQAAMHDADALGRVAPDQSLSMRDSFGHFSTTYSNIGIESDPDSLFFRISANASDKLDTVITITSMCLNSTFNVQQLMDLSELLIKSRSDINAPFKKEDAIFFSSLLMAVAPTLIKESKYNDAPNEREISNVDILLRGINHLRHGVDDDLKERSAYHYLNDQFNNRDRIFVNCDLSAFADEKPDIAKRQSLMGR